MAGSGINPYEIDLGRNAANHQPLTPLSQIERAAAIWPERTAVVHGRQTHSYHELYARCRRLASALSKRGIGPGDTVSAMLPNVPSMIEAHFGVPMTGAVLHPINTRLDAGIIAFMLDHAETKVLITDREFAPAIKAALAQAKVKPLVIDYYDLEFPQTGEKLGALEYEDLLAEGDPNFAWRMPADEWEAISLNYTSGTTGNPKGVVIPHRAAMLMCYGNMLAGGIAKSPVYLWTLPLFHCNGWCFPWTVTTLGGTQVCLRAVRAKPIFDLIAEHGVTHMCGAPIVMSTLLNAPDSEKRPLPHNVEFITAGAAPPEAVLGRMSAAGFNVTHVYGLTEVCGPAVTNEWKAEWDGLDDSEQAKLKARQGVRYATLEGCTVMDPTTMQVVPADGQTMGEVMLRGNNVMKGYLKNAQATDEAFAGGWFHTGDLGVLHPDGYVQLKDRSKDIIISGGENISSIEVEDQLYKHAAVAYAAVVAKPDEKWGETPCAFVELKPGASATAEEILAWCRQGLAPFKCPRHVVFGEVPKTSTGKIQKFVLRDRAKAG